MLKDNEIGNCAIISNNCILVEKSNHYSATSIFLLRVVPMASRMSLIKEKKENPRKRPSVPPTELIIPIVS